MKSKKLHSIAACGLGCALALSMSPAAAFAADMEGTGVDTEGATPITDLSTDSDATTDVKVFGTDSQISVTVPVGLTVAVSGAPGAAFAGAPSNYAIENNSYFDVQVKKIVAAQQEGWDYSDSKVTASSSVTDGNTGTIHIDLFPTVASPTSTTGAVAITKAGVDTSTGSAATKWKINAKTKADTPSKLAIGINGTTKLDKGLDGDADAAATATQLTYTIGRAS